MFFSPLRVGCEYYEILIVNCALFLFVHIFSHCVTILCTIIQNDHAKHQAIQDFTNTWSGDLKFQLPEFLPFSFDFFSYC